MNTKMFASVAALALMSSMAFAEGPIGNCGNQEGSGTNLNGGGNTCGGEGPDMPVMFDMTGGAFFGGVVLGENVTGAVGDHTMAGSYLEKIEAGGATVLVQSGQPPAAAAFATVGVQGGGFAASLSGGPGSSMAGTAVLGIVQGGVTAGITAD